MSTTSLPTVGPPVPAPVVFLLPDIPAPGQLLAAVAALELRAAREPGLGLDGANRTAEGFRAVAAFLRVVAASPAQPGI